MHIRVKGLTSCGEIPERSKGADCKSVVSDFEGSNPSLATRKKCAGIAQLARATAFQAVGCGFEPRFPLQIERLRLA